MDTPTPNGKLRTAVTKWQDRLRDLFRDAGIADGHPHRFRHIFATDALNKGVPLQQVAAFLGNSMRIVEKHYGTWGDEQQRNADEALPAPSRRNRRPWKRTAKRNRSGLKKRAG